MVHFQEHFIGKFSIRNPSHPFIEILRNSNEKKDNLHDLIFQQIRIIFENEKYIWHKIKLEIKILFLKHINSIRIPIETSISIFKSVFVYIFLDQSNYKHMLAHYLIKLLQNNNLVSNLIMVYFSFLKVNSLKILNKK